MAVAETRAIPGGAQLAFIPAISGDPDESGRFGSLGKRRYDEDAEEQSKMRSHLSSKRGLSGREQPRRASSVKGLPKLIIGNAWDCGCKEFMEIIWQL